MTGMGPPPDPDVRSSRLKVLSIQNTNMNGLKWYWVQRSTTHQSTSQDDITIYFFPLMMFKSKINLEKNTNYPLLFCLH